MIAKAAQMDTATILLTILTKLLKFGAIALAIFRPIQEEVLVVVGLVTVDLFTGIWKAVMKKEKINSRKLGNTVSKFGLFAITILAAFAIDKYVIEAGMVMSKSVSAYIAMTEFTSIGENVSEATGRNISEVIKDTLRRRLK